VGLRHGLRFFLYVSLATGLVGCCNCDEGPPPDYPRRPGDIVRELREAIQESHWDKAAGCFSDEIRENNVRGMTDGTFFSRLTTRTPGLHTETELGWPLDSEDSLLSVDIVGATAIAKIDRKRNYLGDERPRELILEKNSQGHWWITGWHSE